METVKSSREIERMFAEGRRVSNPLLVGITIETPPGRGPEGRVAFIAGKRLGGAVERNRAKRVLREGVRRSGGPWPGHDVALVARAGLGDAEAGRVDEAVRNVIRRLGIGS